jgi:hypothetical protein
MDVDGLERILRSVGAPVDRATLRTALEDPEHGATFTEWARVHLGQDNLLTKDELALYVVLLFSMNHD